MHDKKDFNVPETAYGDDVESVLISGEEITRRTREMANRLSEEYRDAPNDIVLLGVLKGAAFFLSLIHI